MTCCVHIVFVILAFLPAFTLVVSAIYQMKGEQCNHCCAGLPGPPGTHGAPGMHGATGLTGSKGDRGEKGYQGDSGPLGPRGDPGEKGFRGERGSKGRGGKKGEKGQMGSMGVMGPRGDKGIRGEKCVSTPRVAFFVTRTSKFGPVNQDTTVEFNKVFINDGNAFSTLTSHFICNINGTYLFNAHLLSQEERDAFAVVMLNEQPQIVLHGDHRSGHGVASNSFIFRLMEGDHVSLRLKNNSAIASDSSTFSGYLIYTND